MVELDKAQLRADTSGLNLTATQTDLVRAMSNPIFGQMPEEWRIMIASQAEFTLQTEKVVAEQTRLNTLIEATPTAKLEQQRSTMQFLASAFEQGKLSAEQFSEAARTALGTLPAAVKPLQDSFLDLTNKVRSCEATI